VVAGRPCAAAAALAVELKDVRPDDVVTFTLPTKGTGWSADGQSIVLFDEEATKRLAAAMATGTVGDFLAKNRGAGRP
jgi:hypothetical protein